MAGNGWMEGNAGTSSIAVGKLKCTARTSVVSGRKHPLGRGTVFCHAVRENPEAFGGLAGLGTALPFMNNCIYLDYNATTPIFPEVADEMRPCLTKFFGNPSSQHAYGCMSQAVLKLARSRLANAIGALPCEVYFTSCGTESNNWAIMSAVESSRHSLPHIVTSVVEHPAVLKCLEALSEQGRATFTAVGVDSEGVVSPSAVAKSMRPETCLVTVMHANNEIGSVQPIKEIVSLAQEASIPVHTDAAQSFGKVPLNVKEMEVDMATFVGHKIGAPKGVAALYVRKGLKLPPILHGGGQEMGRRAGTESMVLLSGFGKAAELLAGEGYALREHMREMRDRLQSHLEASIPKDRLRINGPRDDKIRSPNTLSISIKGVNASLLLLELQDTVAASAGAACKRGEGATLSDTLKAIKVPPEFALGTIRLSVGRHTTPDEIDRGAFLILKACKIQGVPVDMAV